MCGVRNVLVSDFNKRLNWLQLNSWDFLLGDTVVPSGRTSQVDQFSIYLLLLSVGIYSV